MAVVARANASDPEPASESAYEPTVVRGEAGKIFRLLRVTAPAQNGVVHDGVLHIHDDSGGRIDRGDFLDGKDALEEIAALSAILFGYLDTHQAQFEKLMKKVLVEDRGLIHGADQRRDFFAREPAHGVAEQRLFLVQMRQGCSVMQGNSVCPPVLRFRNAVMRNLAAIGVDAGAEAGVHPAHARFSPLLASSQQIRESGIGQREGGSMGDGGGHVRNAVVQHVVDEVDRDRCGWWDATFRSNRPDRSRHRRPPSPRFMPAIISRRTSLGAEAPGIRTPPITRSASFSVSVMVQALEASVTTMTVEDVVEFAQAVEIAVDDGDVRAHADRDFRRVGADHSSAEDGHVRGSDAGNAAQQNAASAVGTLQILRADLHGEASGDFAHGREQRQRSIGLDDGLVGDAADVATAATARSVRARERGEGK